MNNGKFYFFETLQYNPKRPCLPRWRGRCRRATYFRYNNNVKTRRRMRWNPTAAHRSRQSTTTPSAPSRSTPSVSALWRTAFSPAGSVGASACGRGLHRRPAPFPDAHCVRWGRLFWWLPAAALYSTATGAGFLMQFVVAAYQAAMKPFLYESVAGAATATMLTTTD